MAPAEVSGNNEEAIRLATYLAHSPKKVNIKLKPFKLETTCESAISSMRLLALMIKLIAARSSRLFKNTVEVQYPFTD